jgi:hypothetical protein
MNLPGPGTEPFLRTSSQEVPARDSDLTWAMPCIVFPPHWRAGSNVHTPAVEVATLAWLKSHGIGLDVAEEHRLHKICCGNYGGYILPCASYDSLFVVTSFLTLWLFWDDVAVETEAGEDIDELVLALIGETLPPACSRYMAAWHDLGGQLRAVQSRNWAERLGATLQQWLLYSCIEMERARCYWREGMLVDCDAYFTCRTITIGMSPTFHLLEYALGYELGDLHEHPAVAHLELLASRLVAIDNDLLSLGKDLENGWPNAVTVLAAHHGIPLPRAFEQVIGLHQRDVATFDRVAAELLEQGHGPSDLLAGWIQAIRYVVHGFALWESTAPRYREHQAVVADKLLQTTISYEDAHLACSGGDLEGTEPQLRLVCPWQALASANEIQL